MFLDWLASSPLASFAKVFLAVFLSMSVASFVQSGTFDFTNLQTWAIGALAAAVPVVINWLNPEDYRYGSGS